MRLHYLSPWWGHEHVPLDVFIQKITTAGYDGLDTWIPRNDADRRALRDAEISLVLHQHEAEGATFVEFARAFGQRLMDCARWRPLLINSHTGRDHFSMAELLTLIDIAQEVTDRTGVEIAHETHRGRMGYAPQAMQPLFDQRPGLHITADFSHWVCVTESLLDNFKPTVAEAILRTRHIHARVGFEEGPQVDDPAAPEWRYALEAHLRWWDAIIRHNAVKTITTEFGPPPYMRGQKDQFAQNLFMLQLLKDRYGQEISETTNKISLS